MTLKRIISFISTASNCSGRAGRLLLCTFLFLFSTTAFAGEAQFGTQGYFRIGHGISSGDVQQCFKAPGAGAKYRLGNECDNYFDIGGFFRYNLNSVDSEQSSPYLKIDGLFELGGGYDQEIKWLDTSVLNIELGNFSKLTGEAKLWVGRRYYHRKDIHINDFFLLNLKGDGVGFEDLPVGYGKLAYAYMQGRALPEISGISANRRIKQSMHEMHWYGLPVNEGGELLLYAMYSRIHGGSAAVGTSLHSVNGWGVGALHSQKQFFGGENKLYLQYGRGSSRSAGTSLFEGKASVGRLTSTAAAGNLEKSSTFRVSEQHVVDSDSWAWMSVLIYERKLHNAFDGTDQTWVSLGVRPMYFINNNWRLVSEFGHDRVHDHANATHGGLTKGTIALELAQAKGFWERPVLRFYGTYAKWSNNFKGGVGGSTFADNTSGWNAGVQIETWW